MSGEFRLHDEKSYSSIQLCRFLSHQLKYSTGKLIFSYIVFYCYLSSNYTIEVQTCFQRVIKYVLTKQSSSFYLFTTAVRSVLVCSIDGNPSVVHAKKCL